MIEWDATEQFLLSVGFTSEAPVYYADPTSILRAFAEASIAPSEIAAQICFYPNGINTGGELVTIAVNDCRTATVTAPGADPLDALRAMFGNSNAEFSRQVRQTSVQLGINIAVTRHTVCRWLRKKNPVTPRKEAQEAIAVTLGLPLAIVRPHGWPDWLNVLCGLNAITMFGSEGLLGRKFRCVVFLRGITVVGGWSQFD